jgi:hypothetical protein
MLLREELSWGKVGYLSVMSWIILRDNAYKGYASTMLEGA